jgi:hypothetical protein
MPSAPDRPGRGASGTRPWLRGLVFYGSAMAGGNLVWETLHLPLYTIWRDGTLAAQAFAVVHCALADILIALSAALVALAFVGDQTWPINRFWPVVCCAVPIGIAYTIFSEWLNVEVRRTWAYSSLMPIVALGNLTIGLSPILQWTALPTAAFLLTRRLIIMERRSI